MAKGRDEQEFNIKLVETIEKYPCLYNYELPEYSRKNVVENAWAEVAKEVHERAATCKEKWKNVRTVFVRKLKSERSGNWKKPYYLNDRMQFVRPFVKPQFTDETHENLPSPTQGIQYSDSDDDVYDDNVDTKPDLTVVEETKPVPIKIEDGSACQGEKRKYDSAELGESFTGVRGQPNNKNDNDDFKYMFLMSLLPEINGMNDYQMRRFRRKVLALIDDIMEETPSESTSTQMSMSTSTTST